MLRHILVRISYRIGNFQWKGDFNSNIENDDDFEKAINSLLKAVQYFDIRGMNEFEKIEVEIYSHIHIDEKLTDSPVTRISISKSTLLQKMGDKVDSLEKAFILIVMNELGEIRNKAVNK